MVVTITKTLFAMQTPSNTLTDTTDLHAAHLAYLARKAKRIAAKRARKSNTAHLAAMARKVSSAGDATRHYMAASDDLMTGAIVSRM